MIHRYVDREGSSEERGTETNSFNDVFGARLGARVLLRCSFQQLGLRAAPGHRPIASLWRDRLSIVLTREKFGLGALH
jgi:hypothetical protein